jgi:hypothetical protein
MIDFSGPAFTEVDNRIMSLKLVQCGLSGAAMFAADGTVLQPSEALRKRSLIVERGRFRPVTHVNIDMIDAAIAKIGEIAASEIEDPLPIMEISLHSLSEHGDVCLEDFVSRAEVLATTGYTVMISDFPEYYRLAAYLSSHTDRDIGMVLGIGALQNLFDERYYEQLDGGILESLGRLFKERVGLYIYPQKNRENGSLEELDNLSLPNDLRHLFEYLRARGSILSLDDIAHEYLDIYSPDVLQMISNGSGEWQQLVPPSVADAIVERNLFGYTG